MYKVPEIIVETSRKLRKDMTEAEKYLWKRIKGGKLGIKFLRQHPIYVFTEDSGLHRFIIADFYCHERKVIIEIDGSIHCTDEVYVLDREKEKLLLNLGYRIIRFSNDEILSDIEICLKKIQSFLS